MFSTFGQPTQSSSQPVANNNPFATATSTTTTTTAAAPANNPFGGFGSSGGAPAKRDNPFAASDDGAQKKPAVGGFGAASSGFGAGSSGGFGAASSGFGGSGGLGGFSAPPSGGGMFSNSNKRAADADANPSDTNKTQSPFGGASKPPPAFGPPSSTRTSFAAPSTNEDGFKYDKNDPHAVKVYKQLRKDGLSPPSWPSQPGNPNSKAQMAKFREQYEEYRKKVRASLTRAGLIDDPTKRKALQDAIEFRGISQDMCPEYEKIQRITEVDVPAPEKDPATSFPDKTRMVKKLARSAAGQEAPLPMDVLSIPTLRKTLEYLIDDLLQVDDNLPGLHGYLWDRTRAIRRDFSFFSTLGADGVKTQAYVLENIARFHVTALHLLCKEGKAPESFVEQQELEQLGKALLSLRDIYDDCNVQGIVCDNEAEFRAYFLIFHANDPNVMDVLQRQWSRKLWTDSEEIQTAVSLVEALQNITDFHGPLKEGPSLAASGAHQTFFRIVEDRRVSYTMACFAECHFPQLRRSILRNVKRALSRPKESANDVTAATLNKFLRFDTVQEAIDFAELHNIDFGPSPQGPGDINERPLILNNKTRLPHHRLKHQFSQNMVERKRGSRSLPDIIHTTVFESKLSASVANVGAEESLFISSPTSPTAEAPVFTKPAEAPAAASSPFAGFTPTPTASTAAPAVHAPAFTPAANTFAKPATTEQPKTSPFGGFTALAPAKSMFEPAKPAEAAPTDKPAFSATLFDTTKTTDAPAAKPVTSPFGGFTPSAVPSTTPAASPFKLGEATAATNAAPSKPLFGGVSSPPKTEAGIGFFSPKPTTSPPSSLPSQQPLPGLLPTASTAPAPEKPKLDATPAKDPTQPKQGSLLPTGPSATPKSNPFGGSTATSFTPAAPVPEGLQKAAMPPPKPPAPPRDRMKDFAEWFALGDNGLMEDFQTYLVEDMLKTVFVKFEKDEEARKKREQEERDNKKAVDFRRRTLSVTYFYRWKTKAREKRLQYLRKAGRDQLRQFHKRQLSSSHRSDSGTPRRVVSNEQPTSRQQRQQELIDGLKHMQTAKNPSDSMRASSVIVGPSVGAGKAIAESINRHFRLPMSAAGTPARSRSSSFSKGGAKTRALREELMGAGQSRFGHSGSSVASSERSSPDNASRTSNVSERWRLKAMGIVQLPDGTAVPESLMQSQYGSQYGSQYNRYSQQRPSTAGQGRRTPSFSGFSSRRESFNAATSAPRYVVPSIENSIPGVPAHGSLAAGGNKRKRLTNDSIVLDQEDDTRTNSHKRVMSDAENLIQELRAMREEMEEGTMWFKEQNNMLHSSLSSRAGSPS